jgi:hypothetical protein
MRRRTTPLVLAVCGLAALALGACDGAFDPLGDCARPLRVVADDGTRLSVVEHRCDAVPGRAPAVAVWPAVTDGEASWRRGLSRWGRRGRTLWIVSSPLRDGAERADVSAVLDGLAARAGVDPGRLGVIVAGPAARALAFRVGQLHPSPAALLLVSEPLTDTPEPPSAVSVEYLSPDGDPPPTERADRRLWELLVAE